MGLMARNEYSPIGCQCGCGEIVTPGSMFIQGHNRRGACHTANTRAKMSVSHIGNTASKQTRLKMSKSHTGVSSWWNIGRKVSYDHKQKIIAANKGKKHTLETLIMRMKPRSDGYCDVWSDKEYVSDVRAVACGRCGITERMSLHLFGRGLCVHHKNGKLECSPTDLSTLCCSCHTKIHRMEGGA